MFSKMNHPLVSIVIPTYARPTNLIRAIESVLAQTYAPIEIIVVDDNGVNTPFQKETENLLSSYIFDGKITYLKHEVNRNGSAARNTGSRASHGEIIGYLDDDDTFMPTKIEEQVRRLQEAYAINPRVAGVYCNIEKQGYKKANNANTTNKLEGNLSAAILIGEVRLNSSTILLYRFAFDAIEGWDERFLRHQDWEFCIRFFRKYEMVLACPSTCLVVKNHTPNFNTRHPEKMAQNMDFFLTEIMQDIEKMPKGKEILSRRYFNVAKHSFELKRYHEGREFLRKSIKYNSIGVKECWELMKGIIKGIV